jgi:hypothetical protein
VAALAEGAGRLAEAAGDLVGSVLPESVEDLLGGASRAAGELARGISEGISGAASRVAGAVSGALGAAADALGGLLGGALGGAPEGPIETPAPVPAAPAPAPAGGPSPSGGLSFSGGSGAGPDSELVWCQAVLAVFSFALLQGGKLAPRAGSLLGPRAAFLKPSERPG